MKILQLKPLTKETKIPVVFAYMDKKTAKIRTDYCNFIMKVIDESDEVRGALKMELADTERWIPGYFDSIDGQIVDPRTYHNFIGFYRTGEDTDITLEQQFDAEIEKYQEDSIKKQEKFNSNK